MWEVNRSDPGPVHILQNKNRIFTYLSFTTQDVSEPVDGAVFGVRQITISLYSKHHEYIGLSRSFCVKFLCVYGGLHFRRGSIF